MNNNVGYYFVSFDPHGCVEEKVLYHLAQQLTAIRGRHQISGEVKETQQKVQREMSRRELAQEVSKQLHCICLHAL